MKQWLLVLLLVVGGCVSQEQLNGTVTRSRDNFRGTEVIRAEVLMPAVEQNRRASIVLRGEVGSPGVFLGLEIAGYRTALRSRCSIEAAAGARVFDLPRTEYQVGSAGALTGLDPTMVMERFGVVLPLDIAEALLRNSPRFRLCGSTFESTPAQAQTFRSFWMQFATTPSASASTSPTP